MEVLLFRAIGRVWVGAALLGGCDDGGAGIDFGDTGATSMFVPTTTDPGGTQIGNEGFWGCPIEGTDPVEADVLLSTLGGTPADLIRERVGAWVITVVEGGSTGSTLASSEVVDGSRYLWIDVVDGPGCADLLVGEVSASVTRDTTPTPFAGYLAIRPGESRLELEASDDVASIGAVWGLPTFAEALEFRVEGPVDPTSLTAEARWVDCIDETCPQSELMASLAGARPP